MDSLLVTPNMRTRATAVAGSAAASRREFEALEQRLEEAMRAKAVAETEAASAKAVAEAAARAKAVAENEAAGAAEAAARAREQAAYSQARAEAEAMALRAEVGRLRAAGQESESACCRVS
jgi:hypothetical protein